MKVTRSAVVGVLLLAASACKGYGNKNPTGPSTVAVTYSVTGSAQRVSVTYRNSTGGTSQQDSAVPFTYSFTASSGDVLSISAQINTDTDRGSIHVAVTKDGVVCQSADAVGFPNSATATCSAYAM